MCQELWVDDPWEQAAFVIVVTFLSSSVDPEPKFETICKAWSAMRQSKLEGGHNLQRLEVWVGFAKNFSLPATTNS